MYISLATKNSKTCGTRQRGGFPSGPRCQQKLCAKCALVAQSGMQAAHRAVSRLGGVAVKRALAGSLRSVPGALQRQAQSGATLNPGLLRGRLQAGAMASSGGGGGGAAAHAHTNRLSKEESPYLLQHAHNPVGCGVGGSECRLQAEGQRAWSCAAADVLVARLNHSVGLWAGGRWTGTRGERRHSSVRARRTSPSS